mgnify:CR=1 FL=1
MENCRECYILADDSKFNQISSVTFAPFESAKVITTGLTKPAYRKCKNVIEVYQNLILFCTSKGLKVEDSKEKFYFLRAKKTSILFWRNLRLELDIQTVKKDQVIVTAVIYKFGKRQLGLENDYTNDIEIFLNKSGS